ncbi:tetratricopeptide repeat protein [Polaribacter sp.]|uniref:tetratricopeptide repeat protein n=1 Tax=Polaribacter sp. TaxID=1920175 RepID=UPI003F696E23
MFIRCNNIENRKKRTSYLELVLFSLFFMLYTNQINAQDSIPAAVDLTEEKELNFQQFFFKALTQKSIGNYQKSIEYLESCNQILPYNATVFFEFSKNYLLLHNTLLAKEYIQRAIKIEASNIWLLKHLVKVYLKDNDFKNAIEAQKEIVALNPKDSNYLVRLYLRDNNYKEALNLMKVLDKQNRLSSNYKRVKENLENRKRKVLKETKVTTNNETIYKQFENNKSFTLLKQILENEHKNPEALLKYSTEGVSLFPAQPYVYLINGKALNSKKEFTKAIRMLKNGIDFVIEDKMEANFYKEIAKAYKGLGNTVEEKNYLDKFKRLNK